MIRSDNIKLFFGGLAIVLIQVMLIRHLQIFGAAPDLVLIFLLWLCTKHSRTAVLLYAAFLGLLHDALIDLWGIHMFSKTFMVLILHSILNRISKNKFIFWQVVVIVFAAAIIHNLAFYGVTMYAELFTSGPKMLIRLLISAIYSAIMGGFLHMVKEDR